MGSKVGKFRGLLAVTSSNESSPNPFVSISKTSDRDSSALLDTQCNPVGHSVQLEDFAVLQVPAGHSIPGPSAEEEWENVLMKTH